MAFGHIRAREESPNASGFLHVMVTTRGDLQASLLKELMRYQSFATHRSKSYVVPSCADEQRRRKEFAPLSTLGSYWTCVAV